MGYAGGIVCFAVNRMTVPRNGGALYVVVIQEGVRFGLLEMLAEGCVASRISEVLAFVTDRLAVVFEQHWSRLERPHFINVTFYGSRLHFPAEKGIFLMY